MPRTLHAPVVAHLHRPEGWTAGDGVAVLLHGRGSSEGDLQGLVPFLPSGWALYTPRATFSGLPWGYGPGWAWYRYVAEDRVDEGTLEESLARLDGVLEALPGILGGTPGIRVLGGFSQGGTTSLAWALTRPGRVDGVVNLSGFLPRATAVTEALAHARDLPVFWGHGAMDPAIPFALGHRGRAALQEAGARVEAVDHPGGHTITPQEARALQAWLEAREASTHRRGEGDERAGG